MKKLYALFVVALFTLTAVSGAATAQAGTAAADPPQSIGEFIKRNIQFLFRPFDGAQNVDLPSDSIAKKMVGHDTVIDKYAKIVIGIEPDPIAKTLATHDTPLQRIAKSALSGVFWLVGR